MRFTMRNQVRWAPNTKVKFPFQNLKVLGPIQLRHIAVGWIITWSSRSSPFQIYSLLPMRYSIDPTVALTDSKHIAYMVTLTGMASSLCFDPIS
jgi:hypothetical protein